MKKTAVEWLVEQLNKQGFAQVVTDEEIKQAKQMENNIAQEYAEFCVRCDRAGLKLIVFEDWKKE